VPADHADDTPVDAPGADECAAQDVARDTSVIQSELQFTIPLLLEFPKCYWIWNHRDYMLSLAISRLPVVVARQIWMAELGLVSKMLTKDRRNFHAWGYRRRVVTQLEAPELEGTSMVESEFAYTTKKIRDDLSNFSAWHNRSQLVLRLLDERGADDQARKRLLEEELDLVREGLNVGPEDQSLWYYHQFLMSHLLDHTGKPTMAPHLTAEERISYVEKEMEEISDLLEDYEDVKWIYETLLEYTIQLAELKRWSGVSSDDDAVKTEVRGWLDSMRRLDPMRKGRWDDLEKTL
jgi:geranylgeranyl transferase type-2 subunit alpha